jgi:acetyl-CoA carboxylase carboxyl transferase subunit alpha
VWDSVVSELVLPFEKQLVELETALAKAGSDDERQQLRAKMDTERSRIFAELTAWQRVQLARHPNRPRMLDYTSRIFEDFIELHGDRALGDDPAMICGIARFDGRTVMIAGQQKGVSTDEKVLRNWGMPHPEGYRKALRVFKLAERLGYPIITFVDTPAAHPGIEAEQHGQGFAIAQNLLVLSALRTPVMAAVLSEGGSGGALAIAVADWVAMFEHAVYMICPPERCAEILWRDVEKKELAATALRVTAGDLLQLGAIDRVLPEPGGGAHRNPDGAAAALREEIAVFLEGCEAGRWGLESRQSRLRSIGRWLETAHEAGGHGA